jgi:hypothetical protein
MATDTYVIPEAIHKAAEQVIEKDNRLVIRAYGVIHSTEDFIRAFIRKVMQKYGRLDLAPVVEIVVKELIMNAAKANFKKIYFAENNLKIDDPGHYEIGMAGFRDVIDENIFVDYGRKAREAKLIVETSFDFDKDRIIVEVRNNVPMAMHEEKRAREKLRHGLECTDMGQFMMDHMDDSEGAGVGLALCITTMRSADLDPRLLTISTDFATETVAKVEVPLHAGYPPSRERWQNALAG